MDGLQVPEPLNFSKNSVSGSGKSAIKSEAKKIYDKDIIKRVMKPFNYIVKNIYTPIS